MIKEKIKQEAEKQKLSIYQLAKLSDMQRTQLNNFLNKDRSLNHHTIENLFKALNIELLDGEKEVHIFQIDDIVRAINAESKEQAVYNIENLYVNQDYKYLGKTKIT